MSTILMGVAVIIGGAVVSVLLVGLALAFAGAVVIKVLGYE